MRRSIRTATSRSNFLAKVVRRRGLAGKRVAIDKRGWFLPIAAYEALRDRLGAIDDGAGMIEGFAR